MPDPVAAQRSSALRSPAMVRRVGKSAGGGGDDASSKRRPVDPRLKTIGTRVRDARLAQGKRPEEIAVATGIPSSTIYSIEIGRTDAGFLGYARLALALRLDLQELLDVPLAEETPPSLPPPHKRSRH